jgi:hypothetical protein
MANDNSNKILLGLAALAGGTLLASLLADAFGKSRRRERSTVFFDDEADLSSDTEEEVDLPDEVDLEDEADIRRAKPLTRKRTIELPPDEIKLRFQRFVELLEPTPAEVEKYGSHQHTVTRRLETYLGATVLPVGSHARSTYLRQSSDLDLFAIIPTENALWGGNRKSSTTILRNVRAELEQRFRDTEIGKSGPSVLVNFGQGNYSVDVVPAVKIADDLYEIPASEGGWLRSNPIAHNKYLREQNDASGGKLRKISMLVKYWARCRRSISLHSFTTEIILADSGVCRGVKSYGELLHGALSRLLEYTDHPYPDPLGISNSLRLTSSDGKARKLRGVLETSLERIALALKAERERRINDALAHYQVVFNRNFPMRA